MKGLIVDNLVKSYSKKPVVKGLSLEVRPGEIVGLLGPNGAGKTTAFYSMIGLIKPDSGKLFFNGKEITSWPIDRRAKEGLGYLAQEPSVFKDMTVEENLQIILELQYSKRAEQKEHLEELLDELNLKPLRKKKAYCLSGGERRRLEITRSLITKPTCLLLDEPFAGIDPIAIDDVKEIITFLAKKGIGILITDHNAREIFSVVERSYLVFDGKVLLSGTVEELLANEHARSFYFGDNFQV